MKFEIFNKQYKASDLLRRIGYRPIGVTDKKELNCIRPLGGDYPRFHIYLSETSEVLSFSIHLDQKKPSYGEETAHSGDYESETVKEEVQRIKDIILR